MKSAQAKEDVDVQRQYALQNAKTTVEFKMVDQSGYPLANRNYRIFFRDGSTIDGVTDAHGNAVEPAPEEGKVEIMVLDDRGEPIEEVKKRTAGDMAPKKQAQ